MNTTEVVLPIALFFGLSGIIFYVMCCTGRKGQKDMESKRPLLLDAGTRSEEASKIAEQGATTCTHCSFSNFKYLVFCAVCGQPLAKTKQAPPKKSEGRAQRRGEWLRKLDVAGKFYWFRAPVANVSVAPQPAHVFHFANTNGLDQQPTISWVDPTAADAMAFPAGSGVLSATANEWSAVAQQPFPTKFTAFVDHASALVPTSNQLRLRFTDTAPDAVYARSMAQLSSLPVDDVRSPFIIAYTGTSALQGANGSSINWHRDWMNHMTQRLADPATGLFKCVNEVDQTYYINADSHALVGEDHLNQFYAAGRLIGRALLQGDLIAFHLATPLLKILLGLPLSFHDLEHFDPVTYKNLKSLINTTGVESLALDFSVQEKRNGEVVTIDLVPNGRNIQVTDANKLEYLTRKTQHVLVESVAGQLHALCKGFYEVVPQELLLILDPEELDYVLCGSDEIDVDEWEEESKYSEGLFGHPAMRWFWQFVREMPEDYKRRLLHFATGSTRVPVGGFAALKSWDGRIAPFTLEYSDLVNSRVLKATPCFNRVNLPAYVEKKMLKAMLYAVLDPETYPVVIQV